MGMGEVALKSDRDSIGGGGADRRSSGNIGAGTDGGGAGDGDEVNHLLSSGSFLGAGGAG